MPASENTEKPAVRPSRGFWRRAWRYVLAAVVVLVVGFWIAAAMLISHVEPYLHDRIVRDLSRRFDSDVEIGALHARAYPRLQVFGEKLTLKHHGSAEGLPPLIAVEKFDFSADPWNLLHWPLQIENAHISGLAITIPPRGQRGFSNASGNARAGTAAKTGAKPQSGNSQVLFVIASAICDNATLVIMTDHPDKPPRHFDIQSVLLHDAGPGRAMSFVATLTNPKPLGQIDTKGDFGPWDAQEPRDTPVAGSFSLNDADLGTIKGIGGILTSKGTYQGVIDRIEVEGSTDTPEFTVSTGGHPMPLHTDYTATVDGSNGDTYLHPVRATLLHSLIVANGSVVRKADGHTITLDVVASGARIEDLLKVAVKTLPPTLSGPITLHTKFVLPPGPQPVFERLMLDGNFSLTSAHFSNFEAQEKLDQLSLRAQGHPKQAQEEAAAVKQSGDLESEKRAAAKTVEGSDVASNMRGKFTLKDGTASIPSVDFDVPGAAIHLSGDYHLTDQNFLFRGNARLDARLSQMTTGVKSLLLKAVDPFFAKQGAGVLVPIRIFGSDATLHFALDFKHRDGK